MTRIKNLALGLIALTCVIALTLGSTGCSQQCCKDGTCCQRMEGKCAADCKGDCCKQGKTAACPAGCTKDCCKTAKAAACPAGCTKPCCKKA